MTSLEDAAYRLRLADGFLQHAERWFEAGVYFASADASQRAAENAAKALITLAEPPPKTHTPAARLAELFRRDALPLPAGLDVQELLAALDELGPELHIEAGYGREEARLAPWEAIDASRAQTALAAARVVVRLAHGIAASVPPLCP